MLCIFRDKVNGANLARSFRKKLQNICGLAFKNVHLCMSHDTKEGWCILIYKYRENDTKGYLSKKIDPSMARKTYSKKL